MSRLRQFLSANERRSIYFGAWLFHRTGRRRLSGLIEFDEQVLPGLLRPRLKVLDVGGGKRPLVSTETKTRLGLQITGLDVCAAELAAAPAGAYDDVIVGDVAAITVPRRFDLIVSRTVLEHVADTPAAIRNLAAGLKPGGTMAHFMPCGNAPFALLNRLAGPTLGSRLLWAVFPQSRKIAGFPAYYHHCSPRQFRRLCEGVGLTVTELRPYFCSDYARFLLPLHVLDVLRQTAFQRAGLTELCETFTIVARLGADSVTEPLSDRRAA